MGFGYERIRIDEAHNAISSQQMFNSAHACSTVFTFAKFQHLKVIVSFFRSLDDILPGQQISLECSRTTCALISSTSNDYVKIEQQKEHTVTLVSIAPVDLLFTKLSEQLSPSSWMQAMGSMDDGDFSLGKLPLVDVVLRLA